MRAILDCIVNLFTRIGSLSLSMTVDIGILLLVMMLPPLRKRYSSGWKCWVWGILAVRLLFPFKIPVEVYPFAAYTSYPSTLEQQMDQVNNAYDTPPP